MKIEFTEDRGKICCKRVQLGRLEAFVYGQDVNDCNDQAWNGAIPSAQVVVGLAVVEVVDVLGLAKVEVARSATLSRTCLKLNMVNKECVVERQTNTKMSKGFIGF